MESEGSSTLSLLLFARISGLVIAIAVLYWALFFPNQGLTYSTLHPLLMVIGFILVSGEAILIHRWLPGSRKTKKAIHLWLQGVALVSAVFGIWTKFHYQRGVFSNFYSLHSWIGLLCFSLCCPDSPKKDETSFDVVLQWVTGFLSFWHRGEVRTTRSMLLPWHVFFGLYTYGLAIAAAETGLLEKLTFLQTKRNVHRRGHESMIVNGLGLGLALLSGIVITASVLPKYQSRFGDEKLVYSSQDRPKCLSS